MTGREALDHVCDVLGCDRAKAFEQLRLAARDEVVRFRSPQEKLWRDSGCPELSGMDALRQETHDDHFRAQFLGAPFTPEMLTRLEDYEFCRADVLKTWSMKIKRAGGRKRDRRTPAQAFLRKRYPGGVPANISYPNLLEELRSAGVPISERTLRRLLHDLRGK
jgi:hypothetical protein